MSTPLRILSSMATRRLLGELVDAYKSTAPDATLTVESMGGVDAAKRVVAGEPYDLVVLASGAIDKLIAQGHIVDGSRVDIVKSPVAFAVRAGAQRPEIDSEASVKRAVANARSVGYSTGPSGDHLMALFKRWELVEALKDRVVQAPPGVPVATLVASGQVELGFQQLSEFMHASGIDVVGLLPDVIQNVTTFAGGITMASTQPEQVKAVLSFMASPAVAEIKRRNGLTPA